VVRVVERQREEKMLQAEADMRERLTSDASATQQSLEAARGEAARFEATLTALQDKLDTQQRENTAVVQRLQGEKKTLVDEMNQEISNLMDEKTRLERSLAEAKSLIGSLRDQLDAQRFDEDKGAALSPELKRLRDMAERALFDSPLNCGAAEAATTPTAGQERLRRAKVELEAAKLRLSQRKAPPSEGASSVESRDVERSTLMARLADAEREVVVQRQSDQAGDLAAAEAKLKQLRSSLATLDARQKRRRDKAANVLGSAIARIDARSASFSVSDESSINSPPKPLNIPELQIPSEIGSAVHMTGQGGVVGRASIAPPGDLSDIQLEGTRQSFDGADLADLGDTPAPPSPPTPTSLSARYPRPHSHQLPDFAAVIAEGEGSDMGSVAWPDNESRPDTASARNSVTAVEADRDVELVDLPEDALWAAYEQHKTALPSGRAKSALAHKAKSHVEHQLAAIGRNEIHEMKRYVKPPETVKLVWEIVFVVLNAPQVVQNRDMPWKQLQKLIHTGPGGGPTIFSRLQRYNPTNARERRAHDKFALVQSLLAGCSAEQVRKAASVCMLLYDWVKLVLEMRQLALIESGEV